MIDFWLQRNYNKNMKKIWVNKTDKFNKAEEFDKRYYLSLPSEKRLETVQFLREIYHNIKNENRKRLRRVIKVIQ